MPDLHCSHSCYNLRSIITVKDSDFLQVINEMFHCQCGVGCITTCNGVNISKVSGNILKYHCDPVSVYTSFGV